jgi:ribonuclease HI
MSVIVSAGSASATDRQRSNATLLIDALSRGLTVELDGQEVVMIEDRLYLRATKTSNGETTPVLLGYEISINDFLAAAAALTKEQRFGLVAEMALRDTHNARPEQFEVIRRSNPPAAPADSAQLIAYADGSYLPELGRGGWAVVYSDERTVSDEFLEQPTNQRAEIAAATFAVRHAPAATPLLVRSDSQYVVRTVAGEYRRKANLDLWARLDDVIVRHGAPVTFEWVKGHAGDPLNERADKLAGAAATAH